MYNNNLPAFLQLLHDRLLVIETQITHSHCEEIWLELHTVISAHLAAHGLVLPADPLHSSGTGDNAPSTPPSYHDLDWALLRSAHPMTSTLNGLISMVALLLWSGF